MKAACLQLTIVLALISSLAHARREPFTIESSHKNKTYNSTAETINFQVPKRYNDTLDNLLTCSSPEKTSSLDRRCKSFKKSQYRSIVNDLNRMARKLNQEGHNVNNSIPGARSTFTRTAKEYAAVLNLYYSYFSSAPSLANLTPHEPLKITLGFNSKLIGKSQNTIFLNAAKLQTEHFQELSDRIEIAIRQGLQAGKQAYSKRNVASLTPHGKGLYFDEDPRTPRRPRTTTSR